MSQRTKRTRAVPEAGAPSAATLAQLKALLRERNQASPDRAAAVDAEIMSAYQRKMAVMVLDMCGFSRLTAQHGILYYLAMIAQMETAATPAVRNNRGQVFKQEADNLYAVFPTVADAIEGAIDIFLAFRAVNSVVPSDRDIRGSIGIGFGELLTCCHADGAIEDVFGMEMNLASRLGEDLASGSEILLTPEAAAALPPGEYEVQPAAYTHQGQEVPCVRSKGRACKAAVNQGQPSS
jgi:class 3 adenylate cyclase